MMCSAICDIMIIFKSWKINLTSHYHEWKNISDEYLADGQVDMLHWNIVRGRLLLDRNILLNEYSYQTLSISLGLEYNNLRAYECQLPNTWPFWDFIRWKMRMMGTYEEESGYQRISHITTIYTLQKNKCKMYKEWLTFVP